MSRYPLGQPVTIPITVRDRTGALVDAGAQSIVVKVRNADGTQTVTGTYNTPVHDSLGTYHQDIPTTDLTILGHYQWADTSTGSGAGVAFGDFDVFDPFEAALLPLQDAKDACNIPQANTTVDAELAGYVATIENSLEAMTGGPLINTTITERGQFAPDMLTLQVRQRPLVSVTSVTAVANGAAVDLSGGLDLEPLTGEIRTKGGWPFSAFGRLVTTVYVAGWGAAVPAAFNTSARIIIGHLWQTQHGPSARPSMGQELVPVPGFSYAIPRFAAELLMGGVSGLPFMAEVFA